MGGAEGGRGVELEKEMEPPFHLKLRRVCVVCVCVCVRARAFDVQVGEEGGRPVWSARNDQRTRAQKKTRGSHHLHQSADMLLLPSAIDSAHKCYTFPQLMGARPLLLVWCR